MARVKCKKCGNVFEQGLSGAVLAPHLGPIIILSAQPVKRAAGLTFTLQ